MNVKHPPIGIDIDRNIPRWLCPRDVLTVCSLVVPLRRSYYLRHAEAVLLVHAISVHALGRSRKTRILLLYRYWLDRASDGGDCSTDATQFGRQTETAHSTELSK